MKKNLLILLLIISNIFFALLYLDALKQNTSPKEKLSTPELTDASQIYPFLSKRIFAENQNDILINFTPLRAAMKEYVNKQKDPVGVYFEYLPSGSSIGVNEQMEVRAASLTKVPVIMGIYKQIEKGKLKKGDVLTITEKDIDKSFGNLWQKGAGKKISINEAILLSLIESDNTASAILQSALPEGAIDNVFNSLDILMDKNVISPKNYSSILRSLYLSFYLTKEHSNEIIDILTRTSFTDKLPAGVPQNIKVAHKIGVFELENSTRTYSDCGIVYAPQRPYILCIMTNAPEDKAHEYMQHISKMVYGYITLVKGGN